MLESEDIDLLPCTYLEIKKLFIKISFMMIII
jgi:hypothetical protein